MPAEVGDKVVLVPLDGMPTNVVALVQYTAGTTRFVDISPGSIYHVSHDCDYFHYDYYTEGSGDGWTIESITLDLTTVAALFTSPILVVATGISYDTFYDWNTNPSLSAVITSYIGVGTFSMNSEFSISRAGSPYYELDTIKMQPQTAMGGVSKSGNTTITLRIQTYNGSRGKVYVSSRAMIVEGSI